jgi:tetratricopeptide (TPR) repeat protein
VSELRGTHDNAMDLYELALLAARSGDAERSRRLFNEALDKETAAADSLADSYDMEPTRSILYQSAATIALRIGNTQKAKKYVEAGLAGNPPEDVRGEMIALREQILVLEAATTDYRRRAPRGLTLIEQISRRFRSNAPVNITGLARAFGLAVRQANLGPDVAGEIFPDLYRGGPSGYTIRVNASDSLKQKRLTIAHEIAHFLRHRDRISNRLVDDRMYRSRLESTREREANDLAFDLLMPRALIGQLRSSGMTDVSQLAERFNVPLHVMKRRLRIRD